MAEFSIQRLVPGLSPGLAQEMRQFARQLTTREVGQELLTEYTELASQGVNEVGEDIFADLATRMDRALTMTIGWCKPCGWWKKGTVCPDCKNACIVHLELRSDLQWEWGNLVLLCDSIHEEEEVGLKEVLSERNPWSGVASPQLIPNAGNDLVRRAIRQLRRIATIHGLLTDPNEAKETVITYNGEPWVALEFKNGSLRRLRKSDPVGEPFTPLPSDWMGREKRVAQEEEAPMAEARPHVCDQCGAGFTKAIALSGHMRSHKEPVTV